MRYSNARHGGRGRADSVAGRIRVAFGRSAVRFPGRFMDVIAATYVGPFLFVLLVWWHYLSFFYFFL